MYRRLAAAIAALLVGGNSCLAGSPTQSTAPSWLSWLGPVEEGVRSFSIDYYGPHSDFDESFRDIDVAMLTMMRGWRTGSGVELQLGGGVLVADGTRWEPLIPEPPRESHAYGLIAGGLLRYNFPKLLGAMPFIDGGMQLLWTESPFPAGGSAVNGVVRWGGGFAIPIGRTDALDVGYRRAHISNGGADSAVNPAWNGEGLFLSWRQQIE